MGSLERRIRNLEEAALSAKECPVCGEDPESPISDYEVVWDDIYTEDLEDQVNEPEYCHGCGRQLKYTVVWTDLPPMPPERKEREHDD